MNEKLSRRLGIFAKYWEPGQVKTRLAQALGPQRAAELYRMFVQTSLRRFEGFPCSRQLWYSPANRRAELAELAGPAWALVEQGAGDLGARLHRFFATSFRDGVKYAVVLGSDSPHLPRGFIDLAFAALSDSTVALGPSDDGGYYLLGIAGPEVPDVFAGISWSTPDVWQQTIERLGRLRLPFAQLPSWYDVDRFEDLVHLARDLSAVTDTEFLELHRALLAEGLLDGGGSEASNA